MAKKEPDFEHIAFYLRKNTYFPGTDKNKKRAIRITSKHYVIKDKHLLYVKSGHGRIVVTDIEKRKLMVRAIHEGVGDTVESRSLGSHLGRDKTTEKITMKYWWPSV